MIGPIGFRESKSKADAVEHPLLILLDKGVHNNPVFQTVNFLVVENLREKSNRFTQWHKLCPNWHTIVHAHPRFFVLWHQGGDRLNTAVAQNFFGKLPE